MYTPIGYKALCTQLKLDVIPHYRESFVSSQGRGKVIIQDGHEIHFYPKSYVLRDANDLMANLEFALRYEGVNFEIIKLAFDKIEPEIIIDYINKHPTGKYARKIWYLYEFLLEKRLNLPDCKKIKYVDLIDPKDYFTCQPIRSPRHAINNNLLGNHQFCPFVRKTKVIEEFMKERFDEQAKNLIKKYDPYLIARASNYLYTKETMSSYQIEREQPNKQRIARFVDLLQKAHTIETLRKEDLLLLQNSIVDPRFADVDYRHNQNYVGENISPYLQKIHYISPKPSDVFDLMEGLIASLERMFHSDIHPVVIAAIISFGFVFIHPFEDGNGRIHRFLIHYVLSKKEFTPKEMILPVSAIMLQNMREYDEVLESFSKPLMSILKDYTLTEDGMMEVKQETKCFYRYIDYTTMTEYLFKCIEEAIHNQVEKEIKFLISYDKAKKGIQEIVDMPDNKIDLFIKCLLQNAGKLSAQKKNRLFSVLTDEEIKKMTELVQDCFSLGEDDLK